MRAYVAMFVGTCYHLGIGLRPGAVAEEAVREVQDGASCPSPTPDVIVVS